MLDIEARQVGTTLGEVVDAAKKPVTTGEMDALLGGMVSDTLKPTVSLLNITASFTFTSACDQM